MRITSGQYRGRVLKAPPGMDVRPTADKVRQAIFNILFSMGGYPEGAQVLDVFCGTGAMGLEALSRGAAYCTFIDKARDSLQCCRDNIYAVRAEDRSKVLNLDATNPGAVPVGTSGGVKPATLFFLDPPYRKTLVPKALAQLAANGWLAPEAVGVIEVEKEASDAIPDGFDLHDTRSYGSTRLFLVRYNPNS